MTAFSKYDPAIHHRRSIRLSGYDYTRRGAYFITLRTAPGIRLGTIVNSRCALHDAGRAVAACWKSIPEHFSHAALDEWGIMPDHFHGIIKIERPPACTGTACRAPTPTRALTTEAFGKPVPGSIPTIIRSFKAAATKRIREIRSTGTACRAPTWQRNYYEIIIRNECALNNIRAYIRNNPANWDTLRFGDPTAFMAGNRALLNLPLTAFLASRSTGTACRAPTRAPCCAPTWPRHAVARPQCVISGFLSPMERGVFDAFLADGIPMVQVLSRGLSAHFSNRVRRAIDAGRLLIMTPFDSTVDQFSAVRAAWCNQYVLQQAHDIVIGQLDPDGMLACLLTELPNEKRLNIMSKDI